MMAGGYHWNILGITQIQIFCFNLFILSLTQQKGNHSSFFQLTERSKRWHLTASGFHQLTYLSSI